MQYEIRYITHLAGLKPDVSISCFQRTPQLYISGLQLCFQRDVIAFQPFLSTATFLIFISFSFCTCAIPLRVLIAEINTNVVFHIKNIVTIARSCFVNKTLIFDPWYFFNELKRCITSNQAYFHSVRDSIVKDQSTDKAHLQHLYTNWNIGQKEKCGYHD